MSDLPDLRTFVRDEPVPANATLLIRGGPDSMTKLTTHAERVRRAFMLDGSPVLGISVFAALDDIGPASRDGILADKLATYRVVHLAPVTRITAAGFGLLPTFGRPHMTLLLDALDRIDHLLRLLGPPQANARYGGMRRRRKG